MVREWSVKCMYYMTNLCNFDVYVQLVFMDPRKISWWGLFPSTCVSFQQDVVSWVLFSLFLPPSVVLHRPEFTSHLLNHLNDLPPPHLLLIRAITCFLHPPWLHLPAADCLAPPPPITFLYCSLKGLCPTQSSPSLLSTPAACWFVPKSTGTFECDGAKYFFPYHSLKALLGAGFESLLMRTGEIKSRWGLCLCPGTCYLLVSGALMVRRAKAKPQDLMKWSLFVRNNGSLHPTDPLQRPPGQFSTSLPVVHTSKAVEVDSWKKRKRRSRERCERESHPPDPNDQISSLAGAWND